MAGLGPWDAARRVGVAVSGGPDSLALAWLASQWGQAEAIVVDHGLRAGSAAEARWAADTLATIGVPAEIVTLQGLHPGPALAARARDARHAALEGACRRAGLVDLLFGHHADDQAETVYMRGLRGSGPAGLAGMARITEGDTVRRLRPLLDVAPGRLRATLVAAGLGWVEDPSNSDPRTGRAQAKMALEHGSPASAGDSGVARQDADAARARALARNARLYPEGYAVLAPGSPHPGAVAALLRTVSGRRYPVPGAAAWAASSRPATLGGVRILPAGRLGPGWLFVRELRAMGPPVSLGEVWDGRFRADGAGPPGATLGALGDEARRFRPSSPLPAVVLASLPAIRCNGVLCRVPHIAYARCELGCDGVVLRHASLPASCAAFAP